MINNRYFVLGSAVVISLAFFARIPQIVSSTDRAVSRQEASNEKLVEWKQAYKALLPVNRQWIATFRSTAEAKDLLSIHKLIGLENYGLSANPDLLQQAGSSEVLLNGVPIGLQEVCVSINGGGMEMTASNIAELRNGLRAISARQDIRLGSVEYSYTKEGDADRFSVKVAPFCIMLRTDAHRRDEA